MNYGGYFGKNAAKHLKKTLPRDGYNIETLKQMHQVCNRILQGVEIDSITRRVNLYAADASKRLEERMLRPIQEMHREGKQTGILSIGYRYGIDRILSVGGYEDIFDRGQRSEDKWLEGIPPFLSHR